MGHAALTTRERHYADERLARGGIGQAGVEVAPFSTWIDNWSLVSTAKAGVDGYSALDVKAAGPGFGYALTLSAHKPLVLHGERGFSVKSAAGQASFYYSQPFYTVSGELTVEGKVIRVAGNAWLDREWSSQPLAENQTGWDWFSLHLESGEKLMGFRLRDDGAGFTSATWIGADGAASALKPGELVVEPLTWTRVAGRRLPVEWRVRLASRALDVRTRALNRQAWMPMSVPYWEGPIRFSGTHAGRGYLEMTGY
jgi:predicted secreted hydrolase